MICDGDGLCCRARKQVTISPYGSCAIEDPGAGGSGLPCHWTIHRFMGCEGAGSSGFGGLICGGRRSKAAAQGDTKTDRSYDGCQPVHPMASLFTDGTERNTVGGKHK